MSGSREFRIPATLSTAQTVRTCVDDELFALQVTDRSMEPELPRGCVVVIDPGESPCNGDIVIAEAGAGISIGWLRLDGKHAWLVMDHGAREVPLVGALADVRGVVVQRVSGRRSTRKRYR